ncbi:MAG TPA: hypothetical protein VGG60_07515 [Candidatus Binataceae bacterium]|jgi:hypothetical protein
MSANRPASLGAAAARPIRQPVQLNWSRLTTIAVVLVAIGIVGTGAGIAVGDPRQVWLTWLVDLLFFVGIAQGGLIVSAGFYLTQGRWAGSTHYRLAESFWRFLPLGLVLFLGIVIGRNYIFPWIAHPVANKVKAQWLSAPFLLTRDFLALAWMTFVSWRFILISNTEEAVIWHHEPDTIEMPPVPVRRIAPLLAISYAIVWTLFAYDLISSLSPQWHSTLFGWWYFATVFWSAICTMSFTASRMRTLLPAGNMFTRGKVLHDLGKMIFAFSVFWMYLTFAQYIVIWYGDIPTETFFIIGRAWHHPWMLLTWLCPVLLWALPFSVLMGVKPKKTPAILGSVALLGMIGVWILHYILIVPSLFPDTLPLGWIELCVTAGFLGAFIFCAIPGLRQLAEVAVSDGLETSHEAPAPH